MRCRVSPFHQRHAGIAPIIEVFDGAQAPLSFWIRRAFAGLRFLHQALVNSALTTSGLRSAPAFSQREFRDALGQFATGVTIITARGPEGQPVGTTVSSFNALSLHPSLVLWSLGLGAKSLPIFKNCSHYAIHVLAASQKPLAELFALKGADRFSHTAHHDSVHGVPLLDECTAVFECRNRNHHEEGDHLIFIGEVEHCEHHRERAPLLYHAGHMHTGGLMG